MKDAFASRGSDTPLIDWRARADAQYRQAEGECGTAAELHALLAQAAATMVLCDVMADRRTFPAQKIPHIGTDSPPVEQARSEVFDLALLESTLDRAPRRLDVYCPYCGRYGCVDARHQ